MTDLVNAIPGGTGGKAAAAAGLVGVVAVGGKLLYNWMKGWSAAKVQRFKRIREAYKTFLDPELPDQFLWKGEVAGGDISSGRERKPFTPPPIAESMDVDYWCRLMAEAEGPLKLLASELVGNICDYELHRRKGRKRGGGKGKAGDPTHLFFHELKSWLVHHLAHYTCTLDSQLVSVRKRINYLEHVEKKDIFPSVNRHAGHKKLFTRRRVLNTVANRLRTMVLPVMATQLASVGSREKMRHLVTDTQVLILRTVDYLFRVLRDSKPARLDIVQFREGRQQYKGLLHTSSARLLDLLLYTPAIWDIVKKEDRPRLGLQPGDMSEQRAPLTENVYFTDHGRPVIPTELWKDGKVPVDDAIHAFLSHDKSGIHKGFRSNRRVLHNFVRLHGLVYQISQFRSVLDKLYELAGSGGDLLVYGIMSGTVGELMDAYVKLVETISECVGQIEYWTRHFYDTRLQDGHAITNWDKNYREAPIELVTSMIERCLSHGMDVKRQATEISLHKRLEDMQNDAKELWDDSHFLLNQQQKLQLHRRPLSAGEFEDVQIRIDVRSDAPPTFGVVPAKQALKEADNGKKKDKKKHKRSRIGRLIRRKGKDKPVSQEQAEPQDMESDATEDYESAESDGIPDSALWERINPLVKDRSTTDPKLTDADAESVVSELSQGRYNALVLNKHAVSDRMVNVLLAAYRSGWFIPLELELQGNALTDVSASQLASELKNAQFPMRHLNISDNDVTIDGARALGGALARNTTLESLNVGFNVGIGDAGVKALVDGLLQRPEYCRSVDFVLGVMSCGLTSEGSTHLIRLKRAYPTCTILMGVNPDVPDEHFDIVSGCKA